MLKELKQFNLPEIEEKILEFWRKNKIFSKTLSQSKGRKEFIFYEGPPTANGRPGTHHILTRAFKDIILRYKTMRGFFVPRRAGWDTQGLPVEIEVEKELGLKNKKEIEEYGIAEFNKKAKTSVWKYKDEWEKLTERIGLWLDFENNYITYSNDYLEKLWSVFKQIDKRKHLVKGHKVVPWCPRCGTALSSHELAQGYKEVIDNSVYVKFKLKNQDKTYVLSWTTTPWTLPGNIALAVGKDIEYQKIKAEEESYIIAKDRAREILGDNLVVEETIKGKDLIGLEYEPLFEVKKIKSPKSYKIYNADFVTTTDGTGIVHTAVMYGEDDYNLGKELGLPQHHAVNKEGRFNNDVPVVGGLKVKDKETEERIFNHLKEKNYLLKIESYKHEYPFCWRCGTHILYYANDSWFILMSKLRKDLIAANEKVNWIPEYLKEGRFGEWLREVKDWAISRERYWGTPLPIWECTKCDGKLVVGSLEDLNKFDYHKNNYWIGRHGESTSNVGRWISGDKETDKKSELTENGVKQIEASAQKLKNKSIDIIYSSPFQRTKQTAAIYKKVLKAELIYDKRLAEIDCGMFNGKPVDDIHNFFEHPMERFTKRPLNGEHASDVKERMMDFIKEINHQHIGKNIIIISHGDPLWILSSALKGLSNEDSLIQEDDHYLLTGSIKELEFNNWPFNKEGELDLHRPYIDEIDLICPKCKSLAKRVKEVADVWFDSGAMPFATGKYPDRYPADYICEAIDQTRGWFYTLLAIGVLIGEGSPYKNVISLGHLLDKNGQKMSKSKGNVVDPWDLINKYGVDVVRWYFYTVNPPAEPKKFDEADLGKTYRRFVALLYNSYLFLETYNTNNQHQKSNIHILDKWIISRLHITIEGVTKKLDKYDIGNAAKEIESLVDDLSHWYIRRSRKRPEALPILREVLVEISKLIAPFTPFFAEALYKSLENQESVHLSDWPKADKNLIDKGLVKQMAEVRVLVSEALAKRAVAGIKTRQPLQNLKFKSLKLKISDELLKIFRDEINVKEIIFDPEIDSEIELDTEITPELKKEGLLRELSRIVQGLRQEAGYQPSDKIVLRIELSKELMEMIEKNHNFKKDLNAQEIIFGRSDKFDAEIETELDEEKIWLAVQKVH